VVVAKIISSLEEDPDAVREDDASRVGKLDVSSAGDVARISRKSDSIVASSTVLWSSWVVQGEVYESVARPPAAGPPKWSPSVLDGEWNR